MKRIAALLLVLSFTAGWSMPVFAQRENTSIGENGREARRAAKQQGKVNRRMAKNQRKSMKRYQKAQRKAAKRQQRRRG
jgi:hypothetical protein